MIRPHFLSSTRHIKFEGTNVFASPDSVEEAKAAIKELRQKKKEFGWRKRLLFRQRKAAEARKARAAKARSRKKNWVTKLRSIVDALTAIPRFFMRANAKIDIAKIDKESKRIDEILLNIDSLIVQIEGKLLEFS